MQEKEKVKKKMLFLLLKVKDKATARSIRPLVVVPRTPKK